MRQRLRREQVTETLLRHGLDDSVQILGVLYDRDETLLSVMLAFDTPVLLVVPPDVLALQPVPVEAKPKMLFDRTLD